MSNKTETLIDTFKTMTSIVKGELNTDRSRLVLNDKLKADGVKPEWFKSPNKDASDEHKVFYPKTTQAVSMAFPANIRKLINTNTKDLEDGNKPGQKGDSKKPAKGTKRYQVQQLGTKRNQLCVSYEKYLGIDKSKGADQKKTDDLTKLLESAVTSLKRLEKSEDMPCDVIKAVEALGVYITILNTKI